MAVNKLEMNISQMITASSLPPVIHSETHILTCVLSLSHTHTSHYLYPNLIIAAEVLSKRRR